MDQRVVGLLIAAIAAAVILGVIGRAFKSTHPRVGLVLLLAGALTGAGTLGLAAWQVWRWETLPIVSLSSNPGAGLQLGVPHARVLATGDTNHFRPKVSDDELVELLITQFPEGKLEGYRFTVIAEGVRYHVDRQEDGSWIASLESVTVAEGNRLSSIAFPEAAVPGQLLTIGVPVRLTVDPSAVIHELLLLGARRVSESSYVMPSYEGPVRLVFDGDAMTAFWD